MIQNIFSNQQLHLVTTVAAHRCAVQVGRPRPRLCYTNVQYTIGSMEFHYTFTTVNESLENMM